MTTSDRPFKAADVVLHKPSGETWVLAVDEQDDEVICVGWPETVARAADCELVERPSAEARLSMLHDLANGAGLELRASRARRQLGQDG